jgi:four helix bundle protein
MARGSNMEVQTQLEISRELGIGDADMLKRAEGLSSEVGKMLVALMNKL